jgi:hypothetical protein
MPNAEHRRARPIESRAKECNVAGDPNAELESAAKLVEETIQGLGVDPSTVRMQAPGGGHAWSLMRGSAAIAIFLREPRANEDSPCLRVISPVIRIEKARELDLYRHLLELNAAGMASVAFGIHDGKVVAVSERPTHDLDPGEVKYIVQIVGAVADHYDDELARQFGGSRVSDKT